MAKSVNIKYLKNSEIDYEKWNSVVNSSENGLIYASGCYLDTIVGQWDALVYGDYEYVMPITFTKKYGIGLLQQPYYCQQLGVFPSPSEDIIRIFIESLKKRFKYININFNYANSILNLEPDNVTPFNNYLLNLQSSYEDLKLSYNKHAIRHLKKVDNSKLRIVEYVKVSEYINFVMKNQKKSFYNEIMGTLKKLLSGISARDNGQIYAVLDEHNEMCAAAVLGFYKNRIVYLSGVTSAKGRELNAMYFFMDTIIRNNAGSGLILDFEGSKVPGIIRFFEGFGAKPEVYYNYKYNNLIPPLKWIKK